MKHSPAPTLAFSAWIDRDLYEIPLNVPAVHTLLERGLEAGDPFAVHALGLRLLRDGASATERQHECERRFSPADLAHLAPAFA